MSELYVTPAQVLAAKLALQLSQEAGEPPDEALEAIANARVEVSEQSGPSHGTSADEEALAALRRIERQLQVINPPSTESESLPRPPWVRETKGANSPLTKSPAQSGRVKEPPVGAHAQQPQIGERGGTQEEQDEAEATIRQHKWEQAEHQREQRVRDNQERDRDGDGPWSGGI
jgi:hypothetical protein